MLEDSSSHIQLEMVYQTTTHAYSVNRKQEMSRSWTCHALSRLLPLERAQRAEQAQRVVAPCLPGGSTLKGS